MLLQDNHLLCTERQGTEKTLMGRDGKSFLGKLLVPGRSNLSSSPTPAAPAELREITEPLPQAKLEWSWGLVSAAKDPWTSSSLGTSEPERAEVLGTQLQTAGQRNFPPKPA